MVADMAKRGSWYVDEKEISGRKLLAVGKTAFLPPFVEQLTRQLGAQVYQVSSLEPYSRSTTEDLLFFMQTAERIDFSLKGISAAELLTAIQGDTAEWPYTARWAAHQLYWDFVEKTFWHAIGKVTRDRAATIFGNRVLSSHILEEPGAQ